MFKPRQASLLPAIILLLTTPASGQTSQDRAVVTCDIKDNVEEAACRTRLKGLFTRDGDKLVVKLDGGKSRVYVGNHAACDGENVDAEKCLVFNMLRYYPQSQAFLIERGLYECGDYRFVSRRTGNETVMKSIPVMSPNARYLLSIDTSDACDREYDIAIWSLHSDPPRLEFSYHAEQYENWEVKSWTDDTRLMLKAWINGSKASYDQDAELVRQERGWTLVLGKRTDRPK